MNNLSIVFFTILFVNTCINKSPDILITEDGYRYSVIKKGKGAKSEVGQYAYLKANITSLNGDIVYNSESNGKQEIIKLIPSTKNEPNPFSDILIGKRKGDNIYIYLGKGQGVEQSGFDSLIYKIQINEFLNEEEFIKRTAEEEIQLKNRSKKIKAKEALISKDVDAFYLSYKNGKIQDKIITTPSGLKYLLIEEGHGEFYKKGDLPSVHYFCILSRNGKQIDNSYKRGKPFTFPLGKERVIKGWEESFTFLKKGAQVFLIIPSDLAYGDKRVGDILPGDELIYYIETIQ